MRAGGHSCGPATRPFGGFTGGFRPVELVREIPYLEGQRITQESESTLTCEVGSGSEAVIVSFFGDLSIGQMDPPGVVESNRVASESKDYLDIHALMGLGGIGLPAGIACAAAIYGPQYNPALTLQALSYFDDLHEPLPQQVRIDLLAAVKGVSLSSLPAVTASQGIGHGVGRS